MDRKDLEHNQRMHEGKPRMQELLRPAAHRFLSCEPLLGDVCLDKWIKPWRMK